MTKRFLLAAGLIVVIMGNVYAWRKPRHGSTPIVERNQYSIVVDAGQETGPLPEIWQPGIATEGIGTPHSPIGYASLATLGMWDEQPGFDHGLYHVQLRHYTFDQPGASLYDRGEYIRSITDRGGDVVIRLIGTPEALVDGSGLPDNYWAFPPADMTEWEDLIYDELKYLVVEDEVVNNPLLFDDSKDHPTLGLGDDLLFSCWYSIWGPDAFQFQGTEQEFLELWHHTHLAAQRLETDYGVDIQLGGFGLAQNVEEMWGYDGFVEHLIAYSSDPNGDGSDDDRIPIDWIDYQFRHTEPYAISQPAQWSTDYRGQIHTFLATYGYDPDILIMASAWHGQSRVMGPTDSFGRSFTRSVETQCEIDAALNPARLFDMERAGQQRQYREAIQDFSEGGGYPLFQHTGNGAIGIATLGMESEGFLGLKKATWNTFEMIDMMGDVELASNSTGKKILGDNATVNVLATRNSEDNSVQVLVWTYFSPFRYVQNSVPRTQVGYNELYDLIRADIGGDSIYVDLNVQNLGFSDMHVTRYLVDQTHSNAFTYREQICWAIGLHECVEEYAQDRNYTIADVNNWTFDNNPYGISVALETVEDFVRGGGAFQESVALMPYATTLFIIRENDATEIGDEPETSSNGSLPVPIVARQNTPNPFNPSTTISYTVNAIGGDSSGVDTEPDRRPVRVKVYDVRGRLIRTLVDGEMTPGDHAVVWNGRDDRNRPVASGVYLYVLSTDTYRVFRKMFLAR